MTTPTDSRTTVLGVLSVHPDEGQTAREVAEAAGLKYSTVTGILRDLANDGQARSEKSGRQVSWTRRTDVHTSGSDEAVDLTDADGMTDGSHGGSPHESSDPSQTAATASEGDTHPDAPATGPTAATDDVTGPDDADGTYPLVQEPVALADAQSAGDVLAAMTAVRPIPDAPDAPAVPERAPRAPRSSGPAREVRNDFGNGGLQGEVLRYMDEQGGDKTYGPYELSIALAAHASSVSYSLKRTTAKGQTVDVTVPGGKPRFRLATSAEAEAHAERVAAAKAPETAADDPAA